MATGDKAKTTVEEIVDNLDPAETAPDDDWVGILLEDEQKSKQDADRNGGDNDGSGNDKGDGNGDGDEHLVLLMDPDGDEPDGDDKAAKPDDKVKEVNEKPKVPPVLTDEELRTAELQSLLIAKLATGQLSVKGVQGEALKKLLEKVQEEQSGKDKDGHPVFGEATKKVFEAYKSFLETKGVPGVMKELTTMQLGIPSRSPEDLRLVNQYGAMLPEQPIDFLNRMRNGQTDYKVQTLENGKLTDMKTDKPPSRDALDRMLGAESFMKWAQDEIIFDRKVRLQEKRLQDRIKEQGWPKEWLEHPSRTKDRAGWCMAVMQRMEESTRLARTVEAIHHLRTKDGLSQFGKEALENLPKHIKVELDESGGKVRGVKKIEFEHPKDLDLLNPDFKAKRDLEAKWLRDYQPEVRQLLNQKELAGKDPRNFLFQGDIETRGTSVLVDKKTGEVVQAFKTTDWSDPEKRKDIIPAGKKAEDYDVVDYNIIQARIKVSRERGTSGEVKDIVVDYKMQYGDAPLLNYHNLIVNPIGKAVSPDSPDQPDGKLRFKPTDWVVARSASGEEQPMQAKDLEMYAEFEDFKRYANIAVSAVMDASMIVSGAGTIAGGIKAIRGASAAFNALRATQEGMQLIRAGQISEAIIVRAGAKAIIKGGWEIALGASAIINDKELQHARGMYFVAHAFIGLPGISHGLGKIGQVAGFGKDAQALAAAQKILKSEAELGNALAKAAHKGISEGPMLKTIHGGAEQGFKWSNRAFAGIIGKELYDQAGFISRIGEPDGLRIANERMRGIKPGDKVPTPLERHQQQEQFLKTVEKSLEDFKKNQKITNTDEVDAILKRTKELLQPAPKELLGPPVKEKELKEFTEKRSAEIKEYQKQLREYFLFDKDRIAAAEKQRAEKTPVYSSGDWQKLKDDPVIVASTKLEKERVEKAEKALADKKKELKDAPEPKDAEEKTKRQEELLKLTRQLDFAKTKYEEEVARVALSLRKLETKDAPIEGQTPKQKFAGHEDARKAAALAYLLLTTSEKGGLPADGVLHRDTITVPKWEVTKSWTEGSGENQTTVTETHTNDAREISQELKVADLAAYLTPDLTSAGNPAERRIVMAEVLDRLGVVSPETHASVLKNVLNSTEASKEDKNRAIANLGAVITVIEMEEARREVGMSVDRKFVEGGDRFGKTSTDLKRLLVEVATDAKQDKDVRAFAAYQSWVLDRKGGYFDDRDRDFLTKVLEKEPPGITYKDFMDYMKPMAGLKHKDADAPVLEPQDKAGWDRRLRAALALEKLVDPSTGESAERDFSYKDINKTIASCLDKARPELAPHVIEAMLAKVVQGGVERTRLTFLDKDNPAMGLKLRETALDLLHNPLIKAPEIGLKDIQLRKTIIEALPALLKDQGLDGEQKEQLAKLREEAGRRLRASLYAADEPEIRDLRALIRKAEIVGATAEDSAKRLKTAEEAYEKSSGKPLNPDSAELAALYKRLALAKNAKERAEVTALLEDAHNRSPVAAKDAKVDKEKESEIRALRAQLGMAKQLNEALPQLKDRLAKAETEFSEITGRSVNKTDSKEIVDLQKQLATATTAQAREQILTKLAEEYKKSPLAGAEIKVGDKNRPDLSSLNLLAYASDDTKIASIKALSAMGSQDPETIRILKERATPPAYPGDKDTRREANPEVRMAALNALEKVMAPLDFSRLANELVLTELNPAVSAKLRQHTWYSDIGLDPQSPAYQDRVARGKEWFNISIPDVDKTADSMYRDEGSKYYWLNGDKLAEKMKAAKAKEYGDSGDWYFLWINGLYRRIKVNVDNENSLGAYMIGGPGHKPSMGAQSNEQRAIEAEYKRYRDDVKSKILEPAYQPGKDNKKTRDEAQELCYALVVKGIDGFGKDHNIKDHANGWTDADFKLTRAIEYETRLDAARALVKACAPGMEDRDRAGRLVLSALEKVDDPRIRLELLKGLKDLCKPKLGVDGRPDESEKLKFSPQVASDKIAEILKKSIATSGSDQWKLASEMEMVRYLRDNTTPEFMRQTNLFADLEAAASLDKTPAPVRHALWDLIADRRDRVWTVWLKAPADTVDADPFGKAEMLKQALKEVQPAGIGNKEKYDAPLVDGSEKEARVPSAVFKIAAACKGPKFEKDDPRIPELKELMKKEMPGGQWKDERVRLAAAYALLRQTDDATLAREAIKVMAEVAVDGYRPGARQDAIAMLKALRGDDLAAAEKSLREIQPARENSQGQKFPDKDVDMKEASRLGLLAKVQILQGKNKDAEENLIKAFNLYRGKPVETPFPDKDKLSWKDLNEAFSKYKDDKRLREVADVLTSLGEVKARLGKNDGWDVEDYGRRMIASGLGWTHPETIRSRTTIGDRSLARGKDPALRSDDQFYALSDARSAYVVAWNGQANGLTTTFIGKKVELLDKIAEAELLRSKLKRPVVFTIGGSPPVWNSQAEDLDNAQSNFEQSLKYREKFPQVFPPSELSKGNMNLATVFEQRAKAEPAKEAQHLAKAQEYVDKALQIARTNGKDHPIALADQLKVTADYYARRGDKTKADAFNAEAMKIYEAKVGKGELASKTDEELEKMLSNFKSSLGEKHPLVAKLNVDIATHYLGAGKAEQAEKHADEALKIYKETAPDNAVDLIQALDRKHQAAWRQKRYSETIETQEWLKAVQEKQSGGKMTPELRKTLGNLSNSYYTRATEAIAKGDYTAALEDVKRIKTLSESTNSGKISDEHKKLINDVAAKTEEKAMALQKAGKLVEAGPIFLQGLEMRKQIGELPQPVTKGYTNIINAYNNKLVEGIKDLTENKPLPADFASNLQTWVDLQKSLHNGHLAQNFKQTFKDLRAHIIHHINKESGTENPTDPEKVKKVENARQALNVLQKEFLNQNAVALAGKPEDARLLEEQTSLSRALAGDTNVLAEFYKEAKNYAAAEKLLVGSLDSLRKSAPDFDRTILVGSLIDTYAAQGKTDEIAKLVALEAGALFAKPGEASAEALCGLLLQVSTVESQSNKPGLAADTLKACLTAFQKQLVSLPAEKQAQLVKEFTPSLTTGLSMARVNTELKLSNQSTETPLSEEDRRKYQTSLEALKKLDADLLKLTEKGLLDAVKNWQEEVKKEGVKENFDRTNKAYDELAGFYTRQGKTDELIKLTNSQFEAVLKSGNTEAALSLMNESVEKLQSDPELAKRVVQTLITAAFRHADSLGDDKKGEFLKECAFPIPSILSRVEQALMKAGKLDQKAAGELAVSAKQAIEKTGSILNKNLEDWKASLGGEELAANRGAFFALLTLNRLSGDNKANEKLFDKTVADVLSKGTPESIAGFQSESSSEFSNLSPAQRADFLSRNAKMVDKHLSGLPAGKQAEFVETVYPVILGQLLSATTGEAQGKELKENLSKIAKTMTDTLGKPHKDALAANNVERSKSLTRDLVRASLVQDRQDDAVGYVQDFIKMRIATAQRNVIFYELEDLIFGDQQNKFKDPNEKKFFLAVCEKFEEAVSEVKDKSVRKDLLGHLADQYIKLTSYETDKTKEALQAKAAQVRIKMASLK